jgi:hypothetical protein
MSWVQGTASSLHDVIASSLAAYMAERYVFPERKT